MSKIDRFDGNLKAFASEQQTNERTLFGQTTIANDLTSQITAEFLRGWGIIGPSDQPSLQDFNAAMYTNGQLLAYLHQMGVPEFNAAQEYYIGSVTQAGGILYLSLQNNNVGRAPATNPGWWRAAESPAASTTVAGIQRNATQAEVNAGASATTTVTPATLAGKYGTLGTAAAANLTTSQNDLTPGRVLKVGDYGWGGSAPASTNVNSIVSSGTYSVGASDAGTLPYTGAIGSLLHVERSSSNSRWQMFVDSSGVVWIRSAVFTTGVWRAWAPTSGGVTDFDFPLVPGASNVITYPAGMVARGFELRYRCIAGAGSAGYSVGDEVDISSWIYSSVSTARNSGPFLHGFDASGCTLGQANGTTSFLPNKTTGAITEITNASFRIVVRVKS